MKNFLFICGKNKIRSLTADNIFSDYADLDVISAGIDNDADYKLTSEDIEWSDHIFVMDEKQKQKLKNKYKGILKDKKVVVLNIDDTYTFMQPELIDILKRKMSPWLS